MKEKAEIFIWKDGGQLGPFSPSVLANSIRLGRVSPETPAWTLEDPTWRTAAKILGKYTKSEQSLLQKQLSPPSSPLPNNESESPDPAHSTPASFMEIGLAAAIIVGALLFLLISQPSKTNSDPQSVDRSNEANTIVNEPKQSVETPTPPDSVRSAVSIDEAEKCVLMVRSEDGAGTAFIAKDGESCYVYTNVHVASSKSLEFSDFRGKSVAVSSQGQVVGKPVNLSLVNELGIDIVRFPLLESQEFSLRFASRETIEKRPEVWTLGDSGGVGILKTLRGHIKGVGPTRIEVDCEFIKGNSGGPIVTSQGEVVGIASYLTADKTIWAKGTEQEIRRYAWIPGRDHVWINTSADELVEEGELVEGCNINSALLWTISHLKTADDGFHLPDKLPEDAQALLAMTQKHPLRTGLDDLDKALTESARSGAAMQHASHQEFVRFFDSCSAFQENQLDKAEREVRSSFWRNELNQMLKEHRRLLEFFQKQTARYRELGQVGETLNDA